MTVSTSDKIKKSALQLFAQKGYYATSLNDVAEMVGIKKPSLYAHFKNKDDLYKTIIIELMEVFTTSISLSKEEFAEHSTREQLLLIVKKMVDFWKDEELGLLYKRSMLFPEEKFQDLIREQFVQSEVYTTNILEKIFSNALKNQQISNQPIQPLIDAFYCLIDGLFVQRFFYPLNEYEQKVIHAFDHYWKGIETGGTK
ncbi:TetR/AcrR family transcriptional regulator [Sutcliffiella halmapala]|uniref:TetR/AcrR family transcriptional regulator n=1 Tax=Sutcliffiella halmapala TaxID=79882 RepID=UPI0009957160|nr:TetR/AcrR family transcriptional regulator [Sutcliffiella halmapala]